MDISKINQRSILGNLHVSFFFNFCSLHGFKTNLKAGHNFRLEIVL